MVIADGYSDCGGRDYNEDFCNFVVNGNRMCAMVADGLGGHGGGSIASSVAVNAITECFDNHEGNVEQPEIAEWFNIANDRVLSEQTISCKMKTTMAVAYIDTEQSKLLLAHLGDTRIYHFKNKKINYISFDHSVSRMLAFSGEIAIEEIRFHEDRNKLLKAIGNSDEVMPEVKNMYYDSCDDNVILICTDGFWEYVTEEQMEDTLSKAGSPKEWLDSMRRCLEQKVNSCKKAKNDNNTAMAIFL